MNGLILTSLAVFFLWHAALKSAVGLADRFVPAAVVEVARYAAVGLAAWGLLRLDTPTLTWVLAVGGAVTFANVLVLIAQARVEEVAVAARRGPGRGGFR